MDENELISVLSTSLYPGASVPSVKLAINYCKASQLDPMQKPVHIVPMWDGKAKQMRDVIMPGIGLYRTQAARGGNYAGVSDPEFGPEVTEVIGGVEISYPSWCKVIVKRRLNDGVIVDFSAIERWKENYAVRGGKEKSIAPNSMWAKRPYGQLNKCTEAQALRKAFPEFGAQPTAEEMEGKNMEGQYEKDISNESTHEIVKDKLPPYPEEKFTKNFPTWEQAIKARESNASHMIGMMSAKYTLSENQKQQLNNVKVAA